MADCQEQIFEAHFLPPPLILDNKNLKRKVELFTKNLVLSGATVRRIQKVFSDEMLKGLMQKPSSLQMANTYLPELPDGTEEGKFLALDLGGTNFRVIFMELSNGYVISEAMKRYHISDEQRIGCGLELFDYLAECVCDFVKFQGLSNMTLPMGFTFSFPMIQHSLSSGSLLTWTKSFKCSGMENRDVVQMLRDSLDKCGCHNVNVCALLNDTTGTLVSGARLDHKVGIGMILGTGSNACYVERADRVSHWEDGQSAASLGAQNVVIDIEWGAFGDNGTLDFIKTSFDKQVDSLSLLQNSFMFEKYIAGKYLGEVARCVLEGLIKEHLLFSDGKYGTFLEPASFSTSFVSEVELDSLEGSFWRTERVINRMGANITPDNISILQYVCELVSVRAALLLSACISSLLERMCWEEVTIASDGSVFKHHPRIKDLISKFTTILAPDHQFHLILAEDGSGKGAGLTSAVATRLTEMRMHKK